MGETRTDMRRYVIGFVSAVILTLTAYVLVVSGVLNGGWLIAAIIGLAAVQLAVQLVCFLHFGSTRDGDSRWHQAAFYVMMIILIIIVGGSLWIMANLNYNMMSSHEMEEYMLKESSKGF